jgi:tetratricopeptide (TPR) repeat protein
MTSALNKPLRRWARAWFFAGPVLAASVALAQTSEATTSQNPVPSKDSRQPPAFSAAGVQGSTAPSGYSTGISREENSAASEGVNILSHELLSGYVLNWSPQSCSLESELLKTAQASPQAYEANRALGLFYLEHGEFSRSVPYLESARRLNAADPDALHALALALLGDKRNDEARDLLRAALPSSVQDAVLLRLLALAYQQAGNEDQARETYQRAIAVSPNDAGNMLAAGLGLIAAGAPQQAAELFGSVMAKYPNNAKLWLGLGIGQDRMGRKPDSVRSLLRAIAIDRDLAPAYFFLAALADASPESASAIRARLAEFVVAHPSNAEAHYDYALALWLQGKKGFLDPSSAELEPQLRLALAADPDLAKAHYLLGLLYSDADDLPRAESELSETVRLEPGNAEAHYRLARDYQRSHNPQLAAMEMRQFVSLHSSENLGELTARPDVQGAGGNLITHLMMASPCYRRP